MKTPSSKKNLALLALATSLLLSTPSSLFSQETQTTEPQVPQETQTPPPPAPEEKPAKVAIFGDTIYQGTATRTAESTLGKSVELLKGDKKSFTLEPAQGKGAVIGGGTSDDLKKFLSKYAESNPEPIDLILINSGLADINLTKDDSTRTSPEAYKENLLSIFASAKKAAKKVAWLTTTPILDEVHTNPEKNEIGKKRREADVRRFNAIALPTAESENLEIIDMYTFTKNQGGPEIYKSQIHCTQAVQEKQGKFLAEGIKKILAQP